MRPCEPCDILERVMRIPITMCHGIRPTAAGALSRPLTEDRFDLLMRTAAEMGFTPSTTTNWLLGGRERPPCRTGQ